REAADANVLAERWESMPKSLRTEPGVVGAYAERAAALRWEEAATRSLEQALDARWDEGLAERYGSLPVARIAERRAAAERWLPTHPASPALLLTLARLARAEGQWPQAENYLHRAIAQGAGSEAWEELGHGFAEHGDEALARQAYANALRAGRGEPAVAIPGRDLRQQIGDSAAIEERNEHGFPRLREEPPWRRAFSRSRRERRSYITFPGSRPRPCRRRCRWRPGSGRRRAPSVPSPRWRRCVRRWPRTGARWPATNRSG